MTIILIIIGIFALVLLFRNNNIETDVESLEINKFKKPVETDYKSGIDPIEEPVVIKPKIKRTVTKKVSTADTTKIKKQAVRKPKTTVKKEIDSTV